MGPGQMASPVVLSTYQNQHCSGGSRGPPSPPHLSDKIISFSWRISEESLKIINNQVKLTNPSPFCKFEPPNQEILDSPPCVDSEGEGGDRGSGPPPPWKITKIKSSLAILVRISLKNHKATNPAFDIGPSSAHQRNSI